MEGQNRNFCCEDCKKSYTSRSNLFDHIRRSHPDKFKTLNLKRQSVFKCITCEKDYSSKQKLKLHGSRAKHPAIDENSEVEKKKYDCKLCQYTATKSDLMYHIQSSHNIKIEKEILKFTTFKEFEIWKRDIEQTTTSLFVTGDSYHCLNYKTTVFKCNRSGIYECKSTGKKHSKVDKTNKINTYCPAAIILRQKKEECEVEFTKTHFGHENILRYLNLSRTDKDELAVKIAAKIPFGEILDEIRENADSANVKRIDLVTRSDLYNIQKYYNLKSIDGTHLNKRRLSEDSYYSIAKKRARDNVEDLMSRCKTSAHFEVLNDALCSVTSKLDAIDSELKQCIQIGKIDKRRKIIPQRKFNSSIKKKRPLHVEVVEPSESNRIAIQLLHRTIQNPSR